MAYTFTEVETFTVDDTFNRLYADSLDDMEAGTIKFPDSWNAEQKKELIVRLLNNDSCGKYYNSSGVLTLRCINIIISKDGTPCLYIQGWHDERDTYVWKTGIAGKINNSKSWLTTAEFHNANKTWIESQGCNAWEIHVCEGKSIETFFKAVNETGNIPGTFSLKESPCILRWAY